ncbi:MAG: polyprenyl synthetase family protein [Actinomycetota bacterium]|nr:polyprenyl synthetase family protein [Actinomycetota bacterium]
MTLFEPAHEALRRRVNRRLADVLQERGEALPEARPLIGWIERIVAAGGKRLRPAFCYWGYRCGGRPDAPEILSVASSLELLHTFAIVHDDIMDEAVERRGIATANASAGVDVALLVGDLALVLADDLLMHAGFPPVAVARAFGSYSRMRQEVIAGQFLDLELSRAVDVDEAQARRVAVLKSGRYSVEEPLLIGAALAGADAELLEKLSGFAAPLGEAFQLRDDLLGTFGASSATGKSIDSDIRQGKRNILYAKTIELLDERDRSFFTRRWGRGEDLSEDEVHRLRQLVDASGARAWTQSLLDRLRSRADAALAELPIPDDARAALADLARLSTDREA